MMALLARRVVRRYEFVRKSKQCGPARELFHDTGRTGFVRYSSREALQRADETAKARRQN